MRPAFFYVPSPSRRCERLPSPRGRETREISRILLLLARISWFIYPVRLTQEFSAHDRDAVCESMGQKGIATGRYFAPLHRQPVVRASGYDTANLPNTDAVAERVIAMPFFNQLTRAEIHEVCDAFKESIRELRRKM